MFNVSSLIAAGRRTQAAPTKQHNRPYLSPRAVLEPHVRLDQRWSRNRSVSSPA